MIVSVNNNIAGVVFLVFIAGAIIWGILNMISGASDSIEMKNAENDDAKRVNDRKVENKDKFNRLVGQSYSEYSESSDFVFPNDERLDKILLTILVVFNVGIFDKRQIIGKKAGDIQSYVVNRVNSYY